jgi:hypothetical protein
VCSGRLSCRSPPRRSRCRVVWPLEAGTGATPARRAKAAGERSRPGAGLAAELTGSVVVCGDAAARDARAREPLAPPFFASSSGRRRGGSSRGALSDGRSPCISVACIAVRTARCAVASLALLDHVWPLLERGFNPSAFARLAGERDRTPWACARLFARQVSPTTACPSGGGAGGGRSILRARRLARLATGCRCRLLACRSELCVWPARWRAMQTYSMSGTGSRRRV